MWLLITFWRENISSQKHDKYFMELNQPTGCGFNISNETVMTFFALCTLKLFFQFFSFCWRKIFFIFSYEAFSLFNVSILHLNLDNSLQSLKYGSPSHFAELPILPNFSISQLHIANFEFWLLLVLYINYVFAFVVFEIS